MSSKFQKMRQIPVGAGIGQGGTLRMFVVFDGAEQIHQGRTQHIAQKAVVGQCGQGLG
jgi:hypothetical protein